MHRLLTHFHTTTPHFQLNFFKHQISSSITINEWSVLVIALKLTDECWKLLIFYGFKIVHCLRFSLCLLYPYFSLFALFRFECGMTKLKALICNVVFFQVNTLSLPTILELQHKKNMQLFFLANASFFKTWIESPNTETKTLPSIRTRKINQSTSDGKPNPPEKTKRHKTNCTFCRLLSDVTWSPTSHIGHQRKTSRSWMHIRTHDVTR